MHSSEYEAFLNYAKVSPDNCVLLVDTYNTLKSGVPNAIKVAKEYLIPNGYQLKAIRLDSGDLAYLSKQCRKMLDAAGLHDTQITASNSLDEQVISDLIRQDAKIDSFGVGENLITSKSDAVLGGVYKMVGIEENGTIRPLIKVSEVTGRRSPTLATSASIVSMIVRVIRPLRITLPSMMKSYRRILSISLMKCNLGKKKPSRITISKNFKFLSS